MPRTLDELQDDLDADLTWRRTEAVALLKQVRSASGRMQEALTRAGLALLYAHWEGFVKASLSRYVNYVAVRKLSIGELQPALAVLAARRLVSRQVGTSAVEQLVMLSHHLTVRADERAWLPGPEVCVDTRSNLSSSVLRDLYMSLGLDESPFRLKAAFIDYQLLRRRNGIAHGEFAVVDLSAYELAHTEVLALLELVRTSVMNSAAMNAYRRD